MPLIQFDWRRRWNKDVVPHLDHPEVQEMLNFGMMNYGRDPFTGKMWSPGDPPYLIGAAGGGKVVPGKLSWYQPHGRCHWIAPFSWAIGRKVYPGLVWRCYTSDRHTVAVGLEGDEPRVVMDILLFNKKTAEESLAWVEDGKTARWCDPVGIFNPL